MTPRPSTIALAVVALLMAIAAVGSSDGLYDDAFIHLRIARNLVAHGVPYYDASQAVWASSSTPWTLVLAGLVLVGADTPVGLAVLGAALSLAAAAVWGRVVSEETGDERARALTVVVVAALLFRPAIGGMESPLALLAAGVGVWAWRRDLSWCLGPMAIAALVRLELTAPLLLFAAERVARGRWITLGPALIGAGPFVALQLWYYPTWIPNTIVAKRIVYQLSAPEAALLMASGLPWPFGRSAAVLFEALAWVVALVAAAGTRPGRTAAGLLGWSAAVGASYVVLRQYVHVWYLPNVTVPLAVGVVLAGATRRPLVGVPGAFAALPAVLDLLLGAVRGAVAPQSDPGVAGQVHVVAGRRLGEALAGVLPEGRLMTPEIGGLGDGFPGTILDGVGLVSPEVLRHHPMAVPEERASGAVGGIPPAWVEEERPDLVIGRRVVLLAFERRADTLGYVLLDGPPSLRVWARSDVAERVAPAVAHSKVSVAR